VPVTLTTHAKKGSTYIVTASFTDEDGDPVIPDSVTWTLTNPIGGAVINSREDVAETPATSVDILLHGDDLELLSNETNQAVRKLTVSAIYDSVLASDLPLIGSTRIIIDED